MRLILFSLLINLAINSFADVIQPPAPSEPDGVIGGYEYVDLGLPSGTLWATFNVGATTPYESGSIFAWGEVESKDDYTWENYQFFKDYFYDPENGSWAVLEDIGKNICGTKYDAARHHWGNGWRLPNREEVYELRMTCWNKWTMENGVPGCRIYGPNEHSIFLPVCSGGLWYGAPTYGDGEEGVYWSGEEEPANGFNGRPIEPSIRVKSIYVQYGGLQTAVSAKACFANIRAVVNPRETGFEAITTDRRSVHITYRKGSIYVSGTYSDGLVKLFDMSGRMVCSSPVIDHTTQIPHLDAGIYLVSYLNNGILITTQKIAVK